MIRAAVVYSHSSGSDDSENGGRVVAVPLFVIERRSRQVTRDAGQDDDRDVILEGIEPFGNRLALHEEFAARSTAEAVRPFFGTVNLGVSRS